MKTLKQALEWRYPKYANRLAELFTLANDCDCTWENLTKLSLSTFAETLAENVSRNSAKTYAAMFKATLSLFDDEIQLPKGYEDILSLKAGGVAPTWLNENEVQKLVDYIPANDTERLVTNQFILGCLTGARCSDYMRFSEANIVDSSVVYVAIKTKKRTEVPLSPAVKRILSNFDVKTEVVKSTFNRTIRSVAKSAGIDAETRVFLGGEEFVGPKWQFISSHTARRSFATNVYLRCRDIFLVSKYMGHSSVDMTAKYILSIGDAPAEVKEYFDKFQ